MVRFLYFASFFLEGREMRCIRVAILVIFALCLCHLGKRRAGETKKLPPRAEKSDLRCARASRKVFCEVIFLLNFPGLLRRWL